MARIEIYESRAAKSDETALALSYLHQLDSEWVAKVIGGVAGTSYILSATKGTSDFLLGAKAQAPKYVQNGISQVYQIWLDSPSSDKVDPDSLYALFIHTPGILNIEFTDHDL
ncbi:MAG: hypothetical protein ACPG7F_00345 [Aggregatilineales bacterium]